MDKTRRGPRSRGGSGFRFHIPSALVRTIRNKNKPKLPTKRPNSSHPNLTNNNLEELHVVNTNTNEWRIKPGNRNTYVPKNLRPAPRTPRTVQHSNIGPGVRVFQTKPR